MEQITHTHNNNNDNTCRNNHLLKIYAKKDIKTVKSSQGTE
jgi:hypothetical protein